ncbi:MAG: glycosyltransferase family 2 protein [Candidatus Gastranaerophilaceae bacterium]
MADLISVVIPTYNGEKYIKDCIESIQSQDFPHEIIVIDDISTDRTVEIARSMGCRVIVNTEHKGQMAGKNTGIREAKGNYWLTIDQDDMLVNNALQMLYDEMQKDLSYQIVMAQLKNFCSPDTPQQAKFVNPKPFTNILTGSTLFKKEVFNTIGLFREDTITGDVIDLRERLEKNGLTIHMVNFITCNRRIHETNYGITNQADEYKDYAKILRDKIKNRKIGV